MNIKYYAVVFCKRISSALSDGFLKLWPWIAIFLGIGLLLIAWLNFEEKNLWRNVLISIASLLFSGGLFASFLKSYQYLNLFRDELLKIFKTDEFSTTLREAIYFDEAERKNIREIVRRLVGRLLEKSAPSLSKDIAAGVAEMCAAAAEYDYFIQNHSRTFTIKSFDSDSGDIRIHDVLAVSITTRDRNAAISYSASIVGKASITADYLTVDGKDRASEIKHLSDGISYTLTLSGSDSYEVRRSYDRSHKLVDDPYINMRFNRFAKHFDIRVKNECPDKVNVLIRPNGFETKDWTINGEENSAQQGATRTSLTSANQGYIIFIYKLT